MGGRRHRHGAVVACASGTEAAADAASSVRGSERARHSPPLASRPSASPQSSLSSRQIDAGGTMIRVLPPLPNTV
jgi:hypothetical protein